MEVADEHFYETFGIALESSKPDVAQLRPFFQSDNPFVAVETVSLAGDRLTVEDAKRALERLRSLSDLHLSRVLPDPTYTATSEYEHRENGIRLQGPVG